MSVSSQHSQNPFTGTDGRRRKAGDRVIGISGDQIYRAIGEFEAANLNYQLTKLLNYQIPLPFASVAVNG
jgi:hypothetical protein